MKIGQEFYFKTEKEVNIIIHFNRYYILFIKDKNFFDNITHKVYTVSKKSFKEECELNTTQRRFHR